jgi:hypothetical protein
MTKLTSFGLLFSLLASVSAFADLKPCRPLKFRCGLTSTGHTSPVYYDAPIDFESNESGPPSCVANMNTGETPVGIILANYNDDDKAIYADDSPPLEVSLNNLDESNTAAFSWSGQLTDSHPVVGTAKYHGSTDPDADQSQVTTITFTCDLVPMTASEIEQRKKNDRQF